MQKLSNKILKQFVNDFVLCLPFLLLVLLFARESLSSQAGACNQDLTIWLLCYFGFMISFVVLRLFRVPVLNYTRFYFYFVVMNWVFFFVCLVWIFVWGNLLFWHDFRSCSEDESIIFHMAAITLALNWAFIYMIFQMLVFLVLLWIFWERIKSIAIKFAADRNPENAVGDLLDALGGGEIQDSMIIYALDTIKAQTCLICSNELGEMGVKHRCKKHKFHARCIEGKVCPKC